MSENNTPPVAPVEETEDQKTIKTLSEIIIKMKAEINNLQSKNKTLSEEKETLEARLEGLFGILDIYSTNYKNLINSMPTKDQLQETVYMLDALVTKLEEEM